MLRCGLCNLEFETKETFREHMKGEEHLMALIKADLRPYFPNASDEDKVIFAAELKGKLLVTTLGLYEEE